MIGQTISHYKILAKLGEGGMGVVYKAEDLDLKVTRALKFLPPHTASDEDQLTRLKHEARAAAALEHPNICQVHEIGRDQGQTFIVMSFLEGRTLEDRLTDEGPLPIGEALTIATEVGDALKRAHAAGIVHRDIKPANIMLTEGGQAVVMDFGLAKGSDLTRLTKTGTTLGTATYMSPEQMLGQPVDARADLWALGVMLYEMVTGRVPFAGDNLPAVAYAVQHKEPVSPSGIRAEVSGDLERVIDRTLAKDPQQRYQTADELMGDLEAVRDEQDLARKTALYDRRQKLKRRKRLLFGSLAAIVVAAAALIWWTRYQDLNRIDALAVLPFANLSGDSEQEYFSDGMTEALITELHQLAAHQLRVIGRTSVMSFKGSNKSLPEIAAELGVDAVVEASVIRSGDLIKVAAKLIRARPQEQQLWAQTYERHQRDILSLHAEVARAIAEQVELVLTPQAEEHLARAEKMEVDPELYDQFLLGKYWVDQNDMEKALSYFEAIIAADSTYAPAWAWGAHCHIMPTHGVWPVPEELIAKARIMAERSIELDPNYSEGYFILAHILWEHDWNMPGAKRAVDGGFELNPDSVFGLINSAFFYNAMGRSDLAVPAMRRALELDPFNYLNNLVAFNIYSFAGLHDESVASIQRAKELFPDWMGDRDNLAWAYYWNGDFDEAIRIREEIITQAEADGNNGEATWQTFMLAGICIHAGQVDRGRSLYKKFWDSVDPADVSPARRAWMHADLGEMDEAFRWIQIAYDQNEMMLVWLKTYPSFSISLAGDPRYGEWLEKMGLND